MVSVDKHGRRIAQIPFNKIKRNGVVENSRTELKRIAELADSIKEHGLLTPLWVTEDHELVAGKRRDAALTLLRWGSKPVDVRILSKNDDLEVLHLLENIEREELSKIDLALRLKEMVTPKEKGEEPAYSRQTLAEKLNLSKGYVNNLLRVAENLSPEVLRRARTKDVPARVLIVWTTLEPDAQLEALDAWVAAQEAVAKQGKKKRGRKESGGGEEEREHRPFVPKKHFPLLEGYQEVLRFKARNASKAEKAALEAAVQVLNYILGDLKRFPLITAADTKAWNAAAEETVERAKKEKEGEDE